MKIREQIRWIALALIFSSSLILPNGPGSAPALAEGRGMDLIIAPEAVGRLAKDGFALHAPGTYRVLVFSSENQRWRVIEGQNPNEAMLTPSLDGDSAKPRWTSAGTVTHKDSAAPLKIKVKSDTKTGGLPIAWGLAANPMTDFAAASEVFRGDIKSAKPAPDPRRSTIRTNKEGSNFQPPDNERAWRDRAEDVRRRLQVTLGLTPGFPKTPLNPKISGKIERDGYSIEKVALETFPNFYLCGNLYRPLENKGKRPGILSPHGHYADGRVNPDVQMRCVRLAKLGYTVFMYDMVGYNDSKSFGHAFLNERLARWGLSLTALQTWNSIRALDWLETLPDVDNARLGCTGESGGGTQTFLLTALDDRIKASAPVVMVSEHFQGGCVCENAAGLRHGTDNVEFAALCAPRPLRMVAATGDWTANTMTNVLPPIRKVFNLMGSPDHVTADIFDFPHNYNKTSREAVYPFFERWLMGRHNVEATREGEQKTEEPATLWVFSDKTAAPSSATPAQLEDALIQTMGRQIDQLGPLRGDAVWRGGSRVLLDILKTRVGLSNPPFGQIVAEPVRESAGKTFTIQHERIGTKTSASRIPVVRLTPTNFTGKIAVVMSPIGKFSLTGPSGQPTSLVRALLDRGIAVAGFDPLFVGESFDPAQPAEKRPETVHYLTYNKSLAADHAQDLAAVIAWARSRPDVRSTSLIAQQGSGALALIARPALEGIDRTYIHLGGVSDDDRAQDVPAQSDLPGARQFGGLKAAAALSAPMPLMIVEAPEGFQADWPKTAYGLADASEMLRIEAQAPSAETVARWIDVGSLEQSP